jgi:hypothetical protein
MMADYSTSPLVGSGVVPSATWSQKSQNEEIRSLTCCCGVDFTHRLAAIAPASLAANLEQLLLAPDERVRWTGRLVSLGNVSPLPIRYPRADSVHSSTRGKRGVR